MIIQSASEEDVKKMTEEQFEAYTLQLINGLANGIIEMFGTVSDSTATPRVAVLAALVEVAVNTLCPNEPERSKDIEFFVSHFVSRATGQEAKQ
jgi:hypothetical protein